MIQGHLFERQAYATGIDALPAPLAQLVEQMTLNGQFSQREVDRYQIRYHFLAARDICSTDEQKSELISRTAESESQL
jgi:hypothetical protein